jgi:hypothetical protein
VAASSSTGAVDSIRPPHPAASIAADVQITIFIVRALSRCSFTAKGTPCPPARVMPSPPVGSLRP